MVRVIRLIPGNVFPFYILHTWSHWAGHLVWMCYSPGRWQHLPGWSLLHQVAPRAPTRHMGSSAAMGSSPTSLLLCGCVVPAPVTYSRSGRIPVIIRSAIREFSPVSNKQCLHPTRIFPAFVPLILRPSHMFTYLYYALLLVGNIRYQQGGSGKPR